MGAPKDILDLVNRFHEQYDSYCSPSYNEAQLRQEFVNPFFKALGWDVDNEQGYAEAYKEVIHEDSIKIGGSTKVPDYSFRIGGVRKFFVETKKPAVNIGQDVSPAFQLRRYAWSAKLPLSILTDFEEFAVYECRVRPDKHDKASKARTLYLNYEEYDDHWDDIASIFSRNAILKGSFDKYAESTKKKRGTAEVDDAFLKEIEQWRGEMARNLALRNPELSQRELNFAVQKTIDRIIFLRICEDRGIERYGGLQSVRNGPRIYPRLCELFRKADDRYNSGLFHFTKEKDRNEEPDEWTLALKIDDRVLKDIIRRLYYPESPYEFSVLGADILGQVYEQFLGKVIRLTKGHQAKVEDKPEVKKAGGVYYTPTYIVDYIVEQTVGKLLEGKTPHEVAGRTKTTWKRSKRGRPLTVLDPACGSGSFLIGAYRHLLDWYRDWYVEHDPAKYKDRVYQTRTDQWRLTTAERKRILVDHICGVDIDPQAVEVTKLSLLLKVLEGETKETLQRQLFAKQRALPDLADNIKCGNSLIGPDFYRGRQLDLFDEEERLRINVFDWQAGFPDIMQSGGFDAVIGNPPYIKEYTNRQVFRDLKESNLAKYYFGKMDLWYVFACLAIDLLRPDGLHAFIATNNWVTNAGARILRRKMGEECRLKKVVDFGAFMVFESASIQTMIYVAQKQLTNGAYAVPYSRVLDPRIAVGDLCSVLFDGKSCESFVSFEASLPRSQLESSFRFVDCRYTRVLEKIKSFGTFRLQANEIAQGIVPNPDVVSKRVFGKLPQSRVKHLGLAVGDPVFIVPSDFVRRLPAHERSFLKPTFEPSELGRYFIPKTAARSIIYLTKANDPGHLTILEEHLSRYREIMEDRRETTMGRMQYKHLHWPRDEKFFSAGPKVLCVRKCERPICVCTEQPAYVMMAMNVIRSSRIEMTTLTALLNSRLVFFWLDKQGKKQGDQLQIDKEPLQGLPLFSTASASVTSLKTVKQIQEAVNAMTALREVAHTTRDVHQRTSLTRQIEARDREIDRLVYELYGLSDEEIRIVEEATAR